MTLREKLEIEHPECVDEKFNGGCKDCPYMYEYCEMDTCLCDCKTCDDDICRACWDRKYEGELTPQEEMIMRLRTSLEHNRRELEREYVDNRNLCKQLSELEDYVENKTGTFNFPFAPKALYVQKQFGEMLRKRDWWRWAFIGSWIGWAIVLVINTVLGG